MTALPAPMPAKAKTRKRNATPTARSLKRARELGFTADVVERRLPKCFITKDFLGFADLIICQPGIGIIAVQACAGASHAARVAKIIAEPRVRAWLESGGRAECWSWSKTGARGKPKRWSLRREEVTADYLNASDTEPEWFGLPRTDWPRTEVTA